MPGQQQKGGGRRARPAPEEHEAAGFVIDTKPKPVDASEPAQRRKRSAALALSRERELERLVFGGEAELANPFADTSDDEPDGDGLELAEEEAAVGARSREPGSTARPAPRAGAAAWHDDDDGDGDGRPLTVSLTQASRTRKLRREVGESTIDATDYEARLRAHFNQTHGNVAWAKRRTGGAAAGAGGRRRREPGVEEGSSDEGEDEDEDEDEDPLAAVMRSTKPLLTKSGLSASELHVKRAADANVAERSSAVVQVRAAPRVLPFIPIPLHAFRPHARIGLGMKCGMSYPGGCPANARRA
jgi:hypothetical protein